MAPDSQTATFAAVKLHVDNWRWQGVPFYLRSGKAMSCRTTQMVIQFREPPHMLFESQRSHEFDSNRLVIQIQPAEGIQLHFQTKVPDAGMDLRLTDLDFRFSKQFAQELPDSYQRLLLDAMHGDASLFAGATKSNWHGKSSIPSFRHGPAVHCRNCGRTKPASGVRSTPHSGCATRGASGLTSARF